MSDFQRIKRAIDNERQAFASGTARIQSLNEESGRIYADIKTATDKSIASAQEAAELEASMRQDIEGDVLELKKILDAEGVAY